MLTQNGSWSTARSSERINMRQARWGQQWQKFCRSRGGFSTKVHAATDALGCPTCFILTGGNTSYYTQAIPLIEEQKADHIVADRGYDSQAIIDAIEAKGAEPVIPPRSLRKTKREYDRSIYKERNVVERMFNKLKRLGRVSSGYDKLATSFLILSASRRHRCLAEVNVDTTSCGVFEKHAYVFQ